MKRSVQVTELKPEEVWKFFYEVSRIPRPSKKEGKIIRYLERFAMERGLSVDRDEAGNVVIRKPATTGYENRQPVILQSHLDMVCEKNSDVTHDFERDPIETVVDGEWVRAKGTTLGADNGIGVAAELALLDSDGIAHGPLECLFTADEETGLTGAAALSDGFLNGRTLLNLDSEDEGEIFIGCAGGQNTVATFIYIPQPVTGEHYFRIGVAGLKGGHSGSDIHRGLGNANKLLARFLCTLRKEVHFTLAALEGGNLHNAIAREGYALVGLSDKDRETVRILLNRFAAEVENELRHEDPGVVFSMDTVDTPASCFDDELKDRLIDALVACPHGVAAMSSEIPGLVETSTNLASIRMIENSKIVITTSQRSSVTSARKAIAEQVAAVFRLACAAIKHSDGYPGWAPNRQSAILRVAQDAYRRLFDSEPAVKAIHAGLECGLFLEKYPYLDMISFGPTLRDVHSPGERIEIASVDRWWRHLQEILKNVPTV
jgi:dipeptidase D